MKIYVGTSGYGHPEWKGNFYPEKMSPRAMLAFYAERLNSVEINNTFYRVPSTRVLASWAEQVPADFVFALKAPQVITHVKRLKDVREETDYLFSTLPVLGTKSGPVLFQFPKSFPADVAALGDFLGLLPDDVECAFEFRHPSWIGDEVRSLLRQEGHSLCVADTDENPVREITGAAAWGYLRLRRSGYTDADLPRWLEWILSQKWRRAFVFFKHESGPQLAAAFRALADSATGKVPGTRKRE
jgi:uncharacterized protein YecE (DUF72 family)